MCSVETEGFEKSDYFSRVVRSRFNRLEFRGGAASLLSDLFRICLYISHSYWIFHYSQIQGINELMGVNERI
jgi:hypothetical protein